MWRIEMLVDDGKLEKVMMQLPTKHVQIAGPFPVSNTRKEGGKVVEAGDPATGPEVITGLVARKMSQGDALLTRDEVRREAERAGVSVPAALAAITKAVDNGLIRKAPGGRGSGYKIIQPKGNK